MGEAKRRQEKDPNYGKTASLEIYPEDIFLVNDEVGKNFKKEISQIINMEEKEWQKYEFVTTNKIKFYSEVLDELTFMNNQGNSKILIPLMPNSNLDKLKQERCTKALKQYYKSLWDKYQENEASQSFFEYLQTHCQYTLIN